MIPRRFYALVQQQKGETCLSEKGSLRSSKNLWITILCKVNHHFQKLNFLLKKKNKWLELKMQYVHFFCLRLNYGFVYYSSTPIIQKEIPFKGTVIVMQRWQCLIHSSTLKSGIIILACWVTWNYASFQQHLDTRNLTVIV